MGQLTTAKTVEQMLDRPDVAQRMQEALANGVDIDTLKRVAVMEINKSRALQKCSPATVLTAVADAGRLGLSIGGALGQAYLVPYGSTCTMIVGYRGLIELARRSGGVQKVEAHTVRERDHFEIRYGSEDELVHRPQPFTDRGDVIGVYAIALLESGARQFVTMDTDEINAIRDRSRAGRNGPWVTDWAEMAKKTAVRRLIKMLPLSVEAQRAIDNDDRAHGLPSTVADVGARYAPQAVEPVTEPEIIEGDSGDSDDDWEEAGARNMEASE